MGKDDGVTLELSHDEALVLQNWVYRFNDRGDAAFEDQAEQRVLWDLECMLESKLAEVVDPRYGELVAAARERVRDPVE